jgi:hypothetical protein
VADRHKKIKSTVGAAPLDPLGHIISGDNTPTIPLRYKGVERQCKNYFGYKKL